jgi:hypothetical protein
MKKKRGGWHEGILNTNLVSVGGTTHKKGSKIRYKKYKTRDENNCWNGDFEYHYIDLNNSNLIRSKNLYIYHDKPRF